MRYDIGDRVYWNDPDNGLCSGNGTIETINGDAEDAIILLAMDDGGETETVFSELSDEQ